MGYFLIRSVNYSYLVGELSSTQKEGVIICIPKGDKDKQHLKNWRPITLLNISYKIASTCIANRVKKVLPNIISEDQTGFISGRFIGENIRLIYDLLQYTDQHKIPGLLLLIDFEKAFDSVNWGFIYKCLTFFNFGPSFINWIKTFYCNIKTCVTVNGQVSDWFNIYRGCRQGDPISPYIFIICAEILSIMIKSNKDIKGVKIGGVEFLISQYADDTSLVLDGSEKSLHTCLLVLKNYGDASGLFINIEKTKVVWFGSKKGSIEQLCRNSNLCWLKDTECFTLLGIKFCLKLEDMVELNYTEKVRNIKSLLMQWSKRILTPYGRLVVIKSLAIAKINHLLISLPNPPGNIIKELDSLFFKFLWKGGPDKIKRTIALKQYNEGGLKMIKLEPFIHAMKTSWIRRITTQSLTCVKVFEVSFPMLNKIHQYGTDFIDINTIQNAFWRDTLTAFQKYHRCIQPNTWQEYLSEPIWYNHNVKVGGKSIAFKNFIEKGILYVNDLIDVHGTFHSLLFVKSQLNVNTNFLQYNGLKRALTQMRDRFSVQQLNRNVDNPICPKYVTTLLKERKGCKQFYILFTIHDCEPFAKRKWHEELLIPGNFNWKNTYTIPYTVTRDPNLWWLQFRLIHRILGTNTYLHKLKIRNNNLCTFCKNMPETLVHLFWECDVTQTFLNAVSHWMREGRIYPEILNFSREELIFGIPEMSKSVLNFILLVIKSYIFKQKIKEERLELEGFKRAMLFHYSAEKYVSICNCKLAEFNDRWRSYDHLFE